MRQAGQGEGKGNLHGGLWMEGGGRTGIGLSCNFERRAMPWLQRHRQRRKQEGLGTTVGNH